MDNQPLHEPLILPMYTSEEPYLYINFSGQLIFIQGNYLTDIEGIALVMLMGGLVFSPKTEDLRDMQNYYLN